MTLPKAKKLKVLVVDDSAFMRKAITRMLSSDTGIDVVGQAQDGDEALSAVHALEPDLITLDVKMSGMDGLEALRRIMTERPTRVLMVSSLTSEGGDVTMKALELGAVDFIDKSMCHTMMDILDIAESLIQKVKIIAQVDLSKVAVQPILPPRKPVFKRPGDPQSRMPSHLVLIGSSTGGPMALEFILSRIPQDYPGAIFIVQHMPIGFTKSLAERLNQICPIAVKEAEEDDPVLPGQALIAPAGYHLKISKDIEGLKAALSKTPTDTQHCPSVDVLFESAAEIWRGRALAMILTGMGQDGTRGARRLKERAGIRIIGQDEETCVVFGMPRSAHQAGCVDSLVPLEQIPDQIMLFK